MDTINQDFQDVTPRPQETSQHFTDRLVLQRLLFPFREINVAVGSSLAAKASQYDVFAHATTSEEIIEAWASWDAAAGAGTLTIEKLTPTQALDAGTQVLASTWDLTGSANQPRRVKCSLTQSARTLNPGDRLALKDASLAGSPLNVVVTVLLRPTNYNVSRTDTPS